MGKRGNNHISRIFEKGFRMGFFSALRTKEYLGIMQSPEEREKMVDIELVKAKLELLDEIQPKSELNSSKSSESTQENKEDIRIR